MPIEFHEWGGFCEYCDQNRLFRASTQVPDHVVHALFTIVTAGLYGLAWILIALGPPKTTPWRCTTCGTPFDEAKTDAENPLPRR